MGLSKKLTNKQKRFAEALVFDTENKTAGEIAKEVGYKVPIVSASKLQNHNLYPLVTEYIEKLQKEKIEKTKNTFYNILSKFNKTFDYVQQQIKSELSRRRTSQASNLMNQTRPLIQQFKNMIEGQNAAIKVYLAEESRPYQTGFYKIGMTKKDDVEERRTYTDNPYGINYICVVEYIPNHNLNLEKTLHQFFNHYSTKSEVKHGSTEWFQFKNRKTIIKAFLKVSRYLLNRHECKHLIKYERMD
jgi:hypothetical protein